MKKQGAAPLTTLHISGVKNLITDVTSRSFGSEPNWHCQTDSQLLTLFNEKSPLPNQNSWTVFQPTNALFMRVCSVLRMKPSSLEEWRLLPKIGSHNTPIGVPLSDLWEWTLRFRKPPSTTESAASQDLQPSRDLATLVKENKSKVEQSLRQSQPLARRLLWPME